MPGAVLHRATVQSTAAADSSHFGDGTRRVRADERSREVRPEREPKFDAVPELLGFVTHVLLIGVILWSLGYLL